MKISSPVVRKIVVPALALFALAGVSSGAAYAADIGKGNGTTSTCDGYKLCLYIDGGWSGATYRQKNDEQQYNDVNYLLPFGNRTSGVLSNSSNTYCFYSGARWQGDKLAWGAGWKVADLRGWGWADLINSWHLGTCQ